VKNKKTDSSKKLGNFLKKSKDIQKKEAHIKKTEHIDCPDCGSVLYEGSKNLTLCICYGEDWNKDIKIKKTENSIKMEFPKTMDIENIEMLLKTLKNMNKE
jgi:hypothetical protein